MQAQAENPSSIAVVKWHHSLLVGKNRACSSLNQNYTIFYPTTQHRTQKARQCSEKDTSWRPSFRVPSVHSGTSTEQAPRSPQIHFVPRSRLRKSAGPQLDVPLGTSKEQLGTRGAQMARRFRAPFKKNNMFCPFETCCFFRPNKGKPRFTRQCSGV